MDNVTGGNRLATCKTSRRPSPCKPDTRVGQSGPPPRSSVLGCGETYPPSPSPVRAQCDQVVK